VVDPTSRDPDPAAAKRVADRAFASGVVVGISGHADNVIKLSPPLTIEEDVLWPAVDVVVGAIRSEEPRP
jgi:4-aminobutyrate aminotransferase-like enzyme